MSRRCIFLVTVLAALPPAAAGCGGDTLALDPVARAANKTATADSARFTLSATVSFAGEATRVRGEGAYDARTKRAHVRYSIEGLKVDAVMDLSDGMVVYTRFPPALGGTDQRWTRFDLGASGSADAPAFLRLNQADPGSSLRVFGSARGEQELGHALVRGTDTTHYRLRIDLDAAVKQLPAQERAAMQDTFAVLERMLGGSSVPAEVWIDADGYIRRMSLKLRLAIGGAAKATLTLEEDLYDFGADVTVALPPADAVVNGNELYESTTYEVSDAQSNVRSAIPAMEAYNADNVGAADDADREARTTGYAGMTIARLRKLYDQGIPRDVKIVLATTNDYCVESTLAGRTASKRGPGGEIVDRPC